MVLLPVQNFTTTLTENTRVELGIEQKKSSCQFHKNYL